MHLLSTLCFLTALCLATAQEDATNPCDRAAQIEFISSLENGRDCGRNFGAAQFMPSSVAALDNLCTTDCAGAIADYLRGPQCTSSSNPNFNLENVGNARFLEIWCQPVDDAVISRCRFALDQIDPTLITNTDIFSCLEFAGSECPGNCTAGLNRLADGIGCCYQSIYNSTDILGALFMGITELFDLFTVIQNPSLWNA